MTRPTKNAVRWDTTTPAQTWASHAVQPGVATERNAKKIHLDPGALAQPIDGFGGCFNELGWAALQTLASDSQREVLESLFAPSGAAFSYCRLPMGASDFSFDFYSLAETPGDLAMEHFTVEREQKALFPYIHAALALRPDLKLWASPWCPPTWMKTNQHYACRTETAGLRGDLSPQEQPEQGTTAFKMHQGILKAYARYFGKFLDACDAEGIPIAAVHVQNEPVAAQIFPSCTWRAEDLSIFIGRYLGPAFAREGRDTEIWLGTVNEGDPRYTQTVLADLHARDYIKGVGLQWDGKEAIATLHRQMPSLPLMQTETECGDGANDWASVLHTWNLVKHYLSHGARAYMAWNMILDERGVSTWGWQQNTLITIDRTTGAIIHNPEYHLFRHLSSHVQPGSRLLRLPMETDAVAFRTAANEGVLVTVNPETTTRHVEISIDRASVFTASLPAQSINTFVVPLPEEEKGF